MVTDALLRIHDRADTAEETAYLEKKPLRVRTPVSGLHANLRLGCV